MEKLFKTVAETQAGHEKGEHAEFFSLMDRLQVHSHWKYPDRPWSPETYYRFSWEWSGQVEALEARVTVLEKVMFGETES